MFEFSVFNLIIAVAVFGLIYSVYKKYIGK